MAPLCGNDVTENQQNGPNGWQSVEDVSQEQMEPLHSSPCLTNKRVRDLDIRGLLQRTRRHQGYFQKRSANNEFWTNQAVRYGGSLEATASTSWVRAASLRRLKRLIGPSDDILEVGCGNASSLLGPLSHTCRAFGADLTLEMLVAAKHEHDRIMGLVRADACRLPFPDGRFNVVYTSRCLINVLDSAMQSLAIREVFRVAKAKGIVVLIENFEEPVSAANRAIEKWNAGRPISDEHNLLLNLEGTLAIGRGLGWRLERLYSNTLTSFITHTAIRKLGSLLGTTKLDRSLYPLYGILTRIEDRLGTGLPLFGKDTMLVFKREAF
jgi:methyltransferase family protein